MTPATSIVALLLTMLLAIPADAQRRRRRGDPVPAWGIEGFARSSVLKDDDVRLFGGRVFRQIDSTINLGVSGSLMTTESAASYREDGYEIVRTLVSLGPSIELRDSLRGPSRIVMRVTAPLGIVGFDESIDGERRDGSALVFGLEPEAGVVIRLTRALQMSFTIGMFYAWRSDGGPEVLVGPIATTGIRVLR